MKLSPLSIAAIFFGSLALMTLVGNLHYASDLTDEAIEKDARPHRVAALYGRGYRPDMPQRLVLTHPMDCDATMNVKVYYVERGKSRCYSRGEQ